MTPLDRHLAKTFRAARWGAAGPTCPSCFDALDLKPPVPDLFTPGLARYECRVCHVIFSDVKGTRFYSAKPVPVTLWAYLVLHGDPGLLNWSKVEEKRCTFLVTRIRGTPFAAAWREQLHQAGITVERMRRVLIRHPEAA
ncbi:MAG: hypothetical protein NTAFB01_13080 [Nitrospira sp.]